MAGTLTKTVVAPIERVKLLLQLQSSLPSSPRSPRYSSAVHAARAVYREQGVLAFWRGNTPNVLRQAGSSGVNFAMKDWFRGIIMPWLPKEGGRANKRKKRWTFLGSVLSAGGAGKCCFVLSCLVLSCLVLSCLVLSCLVLLQFLNGLRRI